MGVEEAEKKGGSIMNRECTDFKRKGRIGNAYNSMRERVDEIELMTGEHEVMRGERM